MAQVKEPYGLKGWVKLYTYGEEASGLAGFAEWWLDGGKEAGEADWRCVVPEETGAHSGVLIAKLPGVDDRDAAFALKGVQVAVPRSGFAARGENEYYWADLIGMEVKNRQGDLLGCVTDLLDLGPHQVLRVGNGKDERLIPFVAQYVDGVDLAEKLIRVDWGLDY